MWTGTCSSSRPTACRTPSCSAASCSGRSSSHCSCPTRQVQFLSQQCAGLKCIESHKFTCTLLHESWQWFNNEVSKYYSCFITPTGEGEAALLPDKVLRARADRAQQLLRRRGTNPILRIGQGKGGIRTTLAFIFNSYLIKFSMNYNRLWNL